MKPSDYGMSEGWMDINDLLAIPDPIELVKGLLYQGDRVLAAGPEKVGKSMLVYQMATEMSKGMPVMGLYLPVRPLRVLVFQFEIGKPQFKKRIVRYHNAVELNDNIFFKTDRRFRIDMPEQHLTLCDDVAKFHPDVIIFDPLYYMHSQDENSNTLMTEVLRLIDNVQDALPVDAQPAIVLIHHMSKPFRDLHGKTVAGGRSDIRGASVLVGWPDLVMEIRSLVEKISITATYTDRNQEGTINKTTLEWQQSGLPFKPKGEILQLEPLIALRFIDEKGGKVSQNALVEHLVSRGMSKSKAYRFIVELKEQTVIVGEKEITRP